MEPVKIEELKDQTEQNISTPEVSASGAPSEEKKERLSFENRKLEKRLVRLCAQAITDFNLIEDGDKVMVCVSGGKDSYALLDALVRLQGRAPIHFELLAFCLNQHLPDFPLDRLIAHLEKIGVPYHIEDQDTFSIVKSKYSDNRNLCSLCSRLRRGIIYRVAREQKCTKIALGHHLDDVVSTLMLNMFYGGRLKGMPPILRSDDRANVIIRPLIYVREHEIERWVKYRDYPIISKEICRKIENKKRAEIKALLREWDQKYDSRTYNILMSMTRVSPSHLMDPSLYDFQAMPKDPMKKSPF